MWSNFTIYSLIASCVAHDDMLKCVLRTPSHSSGILFLYLDFFLALHNVTLMSSFIDFMCIIVILINWQLNNFIAIMLFNLLHSDTEKVSYDIQVKKGMQKNMHTTCVTMLRKSVIIIYFFDLINSIIRITINEAKNT